MAGEAFAGRFKSLRAAARGFAEGDSAVHSVGIHLLPLGRKEKRTESGKKNKENGRAYHTLCCSWKPHATSYFVFLPLIKLLRPGNSRFTCLKDAVCRERKGTRDTTPFTPNRERFTRRTMTEEMVARSGSSTVSLHFSSQTHIRPVSFLDSC